MKNNGDIVEFLRKKDYIMLNNALGKGSFGKTVLLKDPFIDEIFVAKKYEPASEDNREIFYKNFLDEIKILHKLNHKNVVRVFNYHVYEELKTGYIIMEYIDGDNIDDFIFDYNPFVEPPSFDDLFTQLISGFQYIEEHGIIHRDIREGNILIDKNGTVKIIDFGIGKRMEKSEDNYDSLHSEINRAKSDTLPSEYYEGIYTSQTDQFYLAEMLNRLMRESEYINSSDFSHRNILEKMMQKDPSRRYDSFAQIKEAIGKHDFFVMDISDEDKRIYQNFTNSIYNSLSVFINEQEFDNDVSSFISSIEKVLLDNSFENTIQKNDALISSIVTGAYKYSSRVNIECEVVRIFIDWFKKCTPQFQQLILNNIIYKLSIHKIIYEADEEVPF